MLIALCLLAVSVHAADTSVGIVNKQMVESAITTLLADIFAILEKCV
jgi:hypothetical protein